MNDKLKDFYKKYILGEKTSSPVVHNSLLCQRGAGLLETLLAIAVVGAVLPFAYNSAIEMSHNIADTTEANRVLAWHDPVMAYVRKNQSDWPSTAQIEFDEEEVVVMGTGDNRLLYPYAGFIEKRDGSGGSVINAYLAFRPVGITETRVANIAKNLGSDAAVASAGGNASSSAGWSIYSELFTDGDLIFRISDILGDDDAYKYLHRTYLDDAELNTMRRDLNMAKHSIFDIGKITAQTLNATNSNLWFIETPHIQTSEIYFPEGASIDASKAIFGSINVNGDVNGLRKITAGKLKGSGVLAGAQWSSRGDVVADSVNVNGPVNVQRDMVVRAETARSISGFAGVRANSVATPYIFADQMFFASGYGITISSELLYSTSGVPIKLGSWGFPSSSSPKFSTLTLYKSSGKELGEVLGVPNTKDVAQIMKSGWKNL